MQDKGTRLTNKKVCFYLENAPVHSYEVFVAKLPPTRLTISKNG